MFKQLKKILKGKNKEILSSKKLANQDFQTSLAKNLELLRGILDRCADVKYRSFELGTIPPTSACVIYIDLMVDQMLLEEHVLESLMGPGACEIDLNQELAEEVPKKLLTSADTNKIGNPEEGAIAVLGGQALLLLDGSSLALGLGIKKLDKRAIEETASEEVIRGPRDGFIEVLAANMTLLRRRLTTPRLKIETMNIGELSRTAVAVAYIDGVTDPNIVAEVKSRLLGIEIDAILESSYLEEFIECSPWSIFPQVQNTERPDRVAAGLLEGQVAILTDNTPFALLVPITFTQFLSASEDYYVRAAFASFNRIIRFIAINIALLLPALYISVVTFHQEMLPNNLLLSIAAGRERVPFPAFVEALMMEGTFEILREAGVRLPRQAGQATSIVGALVIGNAAVSAGLVSPAMVIVVALTALASFVIPSPAASFSVRLLRFPMMFLAAGLGLYGIMMGLMAILIHLCSLRSFGVPYLTPYAPWDGKALKDSMVRVPRWLMITRPNFFGAEDLQRQAPKKPKKPPEQDGDK